jgi:hypothetical protein
VKFWYLIIFLNSVAIIGVSLEVHKSNGYFTRNPMYVLEVSCSVLRTVKNISDEIIEKFKTCILCSFLFSKIVPLIRKCGTARQVTDENIVRSMRFACWTNTVGDTLKMYNTYCFFTVTMVTRTPLNITFIRTFDSHGSVHRRLLIEIPTRCSFVIEFIIPKFIEGSTCFEWHTAHHQEL